MSWVYSSHKYDIGSSVNVFSYYVTSDGHVRWFSSNKYNFASVVFNKNGKAKEAFNISYNELQALKRLHCKLFNKVTFQSITAGGRVD